MSTEYEFGKRSQEEQAKLEAQRKADQERSAERQRIEAERNQQFAKKYPTVGEVLVAYATTVRPVDGDLELQVLKEGKEVVVKDKKNGQTDTLITVTEDGTGGLTINYEPNTYHVRKIEEHITEIAEYVRQDTGREVKVVNAKAIRDEAWERQQAERRSERARLEEEGRKRKPFQWFDGKIR